MSNAPFEFTFAKDNGKFDLSKLPVLAQLLEEWVVATLGDDQMVNGVLAFDDDKVLRGIRIEAYGSLDEDSPLITPDGPNSWEQMSAWMREELGVKHLFTFIRRAPGYGHGIEVGQWDVDMCRISEALADEDELNFQGHIILNGTEAAIVPPPHVTTRRGLSIDHALRALDGPSQAAIGQAALDRIMEADPDVDTVVIEAVNMAIERAVSGTTAPPTAEEMALVQEAIAALEQSLDRIRSAELGLLGGALEATRPPTPPETPARPDVPPAFYN